MYNPTIRIILGILGLGMALLFYSSGNMTSMYLALAAVGLVIWGYFKNGTVFIAFQQLKKENYEKAEQLISMIKFPDLLKTSQKGYYHFTKGFIQLNKQNNDAGFNELKSALLFGLRTENDTSIVTLNLALIEFENKNIDEAVEYLKKTKSLKHKPELDSEIRRFEDKINEYTTQ